LFAHGQPVVTIRKACPHCGSDALLRIEAPPVDAYVRYADLWSAMKASRWGYGSAAG
jgi:hypothetical protein